MRFERIRLRNVRPYADADLSLDRGVSVIHGPNGSGKSSLLEACFFALYGSKALADATLDDVVTKGEDEAEIELWFAHDGGDYHVRRRLRVTGDRARHAECVMETPDGTVEGATAVRERVREMLRMDADAFVNCAYVRQGEVNKLIHASPTDRQDMIDDLLQLGKLETYRERASEARLGVEDVLTGQRERAEGLQEQIDEKERKNLHETLNDLESRRNEVDGEIERYETNRDNARETLQEAEDVLERYREKRSELADLESTIDDLQSAIAETESERDQLQSKLQDERERLEDRRSERDDLAAAADLADPDRETVADRLDSLRTEDDDLADRIADLKVELEEHAGEAERLRERADELDEEAAEKRSTAADLADRIAENEEVLEDRRETLSELAATVEDLEAEFVDAPVDLGEAEAYRDELQAERRDLQEEIASTEATLESVREDVAEAEALVEAGKCPECGQSVEESPHVDRLDEDRERVAELASTLSTLRENLADLDERIERATELVEAETERERTRERRRNLEQLLEEKGESIATDRERLAELRAEADDLAERATEKRSTAEDHEAEADDRRESITDLDSQRSELRDRIDRLADLDDVLDAIDDLEAEVESIRDRRSSLADLNDERRDRLAEKRSRREELREEFEDEKVEEARQERDRAENYLEQVEEKLSSLRERRDDLMDRIGGVRNELDELDRLREKLQAVEERRDALASLYEESERLQETYGDLRADLRQRNVETLERMLNETFELVYQNDSYARIELDGNYELTVYQKDGQPLDPEQLSGGERALFNLSLRTAIYRLLAEGIEGTAPLPPLILDEPTVFLDSGHVSRLIDLVEEMRTLGVEQIVVVTHDEELIGAADAVVRVSKDPTTNRSSVERSDADVVPTP